MRGSAVHIVGDEEEEEEEEEEKEETSITDGILYPVCVLATSPLCSRTRRRGWICMV
jgi:hypothetical protein